MSDLIATAARRFPKHANNFGNAIKSAFADRSNPEDAFFLSMFNRTRAQESRRLDEEARRWRVLVRDSQRFPVNFKYAPKALDLYLRGNPGGGSMKVPPAWLLGFSKARKALDVNRKRFAGWMDGSQPSRFKNDIVFRKLLRLDEGEVHRQKTLWERRFREMRPNELRFLSAGSTIKSTGEFTFTRIGGNIHVTGVVVHRWHDRFDFGEKRIVPIPSRTDSTIYGMQHFYASALAKYRGAQAFDIESVWKESVTGVLRIKDGRIIPVLRWSKLKKRKGG